MNNIKIGFIGAGHIANSMSKAIDNIYGITKYAVASRNIEKAQIFANAHNFEKSYSSYEDLLKDRNVELVYIATPVSHHYKHVKMSLNYGKHVLCEKTFTSNYKEAEELINIAKSRRLLLTEAIWTRYMPSRYKLESFIDSGIVGVPKLLEANLGYILTNKPRLFNPNLSGGALYELGVYPLNFMMTALKNYKITGITPISIVNKEGIDLQSSITFKYENEIIATILYSIISMTDSRGVISCTNGYIVVENINNPQSISVFSQERILLDQYIKNDNIKGYEYQLCSIIKSIYNNQIECTDMTHSEILKEMKIIDFIKNN